MALLSSHFAITLKICYNIVEVIYMAMKEGTKTLSLRISSELKFDIEKEAYKQGRSVNNLLNQIIKEYVETVKK